MSWNKDKKIKVFGFNQKSNSKYREVPILVLDQSSRSPKKHQITIDQMLIQSNNHNPSFQFSPKQQAQPIFYQDNLLQKYLGLISESQIDNNQHINTHINQNSLSRLINADQKSKDIGLSPITAKRQSQKQIIYGSTPHSIIQTHSAIPNYNNFEDGKQLLFYFNSPIHKDNNSQFNSKESIIQAGQHQNSQDLHLAQSLNSLIKNDSSKCQQSSRVKNGSLKSDIHLTMKQLMLQSNGNKFKQQKLIKKDNLCFFDKLDGDYQIPLINSQGQGRIDKYISKNKKGLNMSQSQLRDRKKERSLKSYLAIEQDYGRQIQTMISKYEKVAQLKQKTNDINNAIKKLTYKKTPSQSLNKDYYTDFTKDVGAQIQVQHSNRPHSNGFASDSTWRKSRTAVKFDAQLKKQLRNMEKLIDKLKDISESLNGSKQKLSSDDEFQKMQCCIQSNISPFNYDEPTEPLSSKNPLQEHRQQLKNASCQKMISDPRIRNYKQLLEGLKQKQKKDAKGECKLMAEKCRQNYNCGCKYNQISQQIIKLKKKIQFLQSQRRTSQQIQQSKVYPIKMSKQQPQINHQYFNHNSPPPKYKVQCTTGTQQTIKKIQSASKRHALQKNQKDKAMLTQSRSDQFDSKVVLSRYMTQVKHVKKRALKLQNNLAIPQKPYIDISKNKLRLSFPSIEFYPQAHSSQHELIYFGEYMYDHFYKFLAHYFDKKYREPTGNFKIKKYTDCIHFFINNTLDFHLIYYFRGKLYFGQIFINKGQYLKHGIGYYCNLAKYKYAGQFSYDKRNGQGTINYLNGDSYKGNWVNAKKEGRGAFLNSIGDYYEGMYLKGKKEGSGFQLLANGDFYQGEFQEGKLNGKGLYWWKDGSFYRGTFKSGLLHGKGFWISKEMDYYEGQYRQNQKHGIGTYHWSNGVILSGKFVNDVHSPPLWTPVSSQSITNMFYKGK